MRPELRLHDLLGGLACLLISSTPVFAHHGYAAYDMTKTESVKATIVNLLLENPHSTIAFDVKDASGNVQHWFSEGPNPRNMKREGYTPENIKVGDQVTVYFHPSRDGSHVVVLTKVEFPDGHVLPMKGTNEDQ